MRSTASSSCGTTELLSPVSLKLSEILSNSAAIHESQSILSSITTHNDTALESSRRNTDSRTHCLSSETLAPLISVHQTPTCGEVNKNFCETLVSGSKTEISLLDSNLANQSALPSFPPVQAAQSGYDQDYINHRKIL